MNTFIVIIGGHDCCTVTPRSHPKLFRHFAATPKGIHFREGVLLVRDAGSLNALFQVVQSLVNPSDDVFVFQVADAKSAASGPHAETFRALFDTLGG